MDAKGVARWIAGALVATVAVVSIAACPGGNPPPPDAEGRPECPQDSVFIVNKYKNDRGSFTQIVTTIPVSGPITNVPEYHDCQRFAMSPDPKYGPLVAIFANHGLDSMFPAPFDSSAQPPSEAAAEIYSWDGDYAPLSIRKGFNCLYLHQTPNGWTALMTSVGDANDCLQKPASGTPLGVTSAKPSSDVNDYPPVARWDWDPQRHQHYISIRCGDEWCEVGPMAGFAASASHPATTLPDEAVPGMGAPTSRERHRVLEIKGWYDEQHLAVADGSGLLVGTMTGTAFPHPLLERLKAVGQFSLKWIPSAYVQLDSDPGPYKGKLNLDQGLNTMYLCEGAFADCPGVPTGTTEPSCPDGADHRWWAKIISAGGDSVYRCVQRRIHNGVEMPGAVRWRWKETDETMWVRCPQGCCTVN